MVDKLFDIQHDSKVHSLTFKSSYYANCNIQDRNNLAETDTEDLQKIEKVKTRFRRQFLEQNAPSGMVYMLTKETFLEVIKATCYYYRQQEHSLKRQLGESKMRERQTTSSQQKPWINNNKPQRQGIIGRSKVSTIKCA